MAVLPQTQRRIGQSLSDWPEFCRSLLATRAELSSTDETAFWYPLVERPFDRDGDFSGGFTGVDLLRAIALARLVLPAKVEVQAPLATLGPKLAQVALDCGASHLGYVAPDGQTPGDPLIADPKLLEELLEPDS